MKTLKNYRPAISYRKFAIVCSFASCIALLPLHAGDADTTPDKNSQNLRSKISDSKLSFPADIQREEEMLMEFWMINPEHTSWFTDKEQEIGLARWMMDIHSGSWMSETVKEGDPDLQKWMLLPNNWLQ